MNNAVIGGLLGLGLIGCANIYITYSMAEIQNDQLTNAMVEVEEKVAKKLYKDFKSNKPDSYQEIIVKSDRILNHALYLANQNYAGNLLNEDIALYASNAYDEIMGNTYNNLFYAKLTSLGIAQPKVTFFKEGDNGVEYGVPHQLSNGAIVREKYRIDFDSASMLGGLLQTGAISTDFLYMVNDLIAYPQCAEGESPVIVFGELYPKQNGYKLNAELIPEQGGWRVNFKDVDNMSQTALSNRVIHQSACRSIVANDTQPEEVVG